MQKAKQLVQQQQQQLNTNPPTLKSQEDRLCSRSTQTHNLKTKRICVAAQDNLPTISKRQKGLCSSS
jgi:hypothetical protein